MSIYRTKRAVEVYDFLLKAIGAYRKYIVIVLLFLYYVIYISFSSI